MCIRDSRVEKETSLAQAMESGETYLRYDNYAKAAEEYRTAKSLSQELKEEETGREADQYIKLAEQIILCLLYTSHRYCPGPEREAVSDQLPGASSRTFNRREPAEECGCAVPGVF